MDTAAKYLFVYGTLLKDSRHEMSDFLLSHAVNIGSAYFHGKLFQVSWFPGAILSNINSERVYGSLFKLNDLEIVFKTLDDYEGVSKLSPQFSLFKRELVTAYFEDGSTIETWVYLYNLPTKNLKLISSGNFLKA